MRPTNSTGKRGMRQKVDSIVFAPPAVAGGVKSLYSVCTWLNDLGRSTITPFSEPKLAEWFNHDCVLYDYSYPPDVLLYPEVYQPHAEGTNYHICFALGKRRLIESHADLTVCKSFEVLNWVREQHPSMPTALILPSIDRSVFEYDGRSKKEMICYMTRPHKHPETASLLRREYGDQVREIIDFSEAEVAETLKDARVFVWRGDEMEGSPRPPKEALVAGCVVVGLESDLNENYHTNFGIRCSNIHEVIRMAGEALRMPVPTYEERSVIRDSTDEKHDWLELFQRLDIGNPELEVGSSMKDRRRVEYKLSRDQIAQRAVSRMPSAGKAAERKDQIQELLSEVAEKERAIQELSAQLADSQQVQQELSAELSHKQQSLQELSAELVHNQQSLQELSAELAHNQQSVRELSADLAHNQQSLWAAWEHIADNQQSLRAISERSPDDQRSIQYLSEMLAAKETELKRITNSLGWRILKLYGKIKYPYLLPVYRLLNLMPREPKDK